MDPTEQLLDILDRHLGNGDADLIQSYQRTLDYIRRLPETEERD